MCQSILGVFEEMSYFQGVKTPAFKNFTKLVETIGLQNFYVFIEFDKSYVIVQLIIFVCIEMGCSSYPQSISVSIFILFSSNCIFIFHIPDDLPCFLTSSYFDCHLLIFRVLSHLLNISLCQHLSFFSLLLITVRFSALATLFSSYL